MSRDGALRTNEMGLGVGHHFGNWATGTEGVLILGGLCVGVHIKLCHLIELGIRFGTVLVPLDIFKLYSWKLDESVLDFNEYIPIRNQYIQCDFPAI